MPTTAEDWLYCDGCDKVTTDPYRVNPWTGQPLPQGGYCPRCYEARCARAQHDAAMAQRVEVEAPAGRRIRRHAPE